MGRVCLICEEEAEYGVKNTKDYYCKECAQEQFGDISYLVSIKENNTQQEKDVIEKIEEEQEILRDKE